jgi:Family of unknown function (DUF6527)
MNPGITVQHKFVDSLPDVLEEKTLYVCMEFATAAHKCICGCGREVVTPLSPTDWKLVYDGRAVTLHPSIGNWSFPCRSHYWIRSNRVEWAPSWSDEEVRAGKLHDRLTKDWYFDAVAGGQADGPSKGAPEPENHAEADRIGRWQRVVQWWKSF